jgi:hypothetical protein
VTFPWGLAFGPDGDLYVSSFGGSPTSAWNSVLRYDGATGAFVDVFVTSGSGGLGGPAFLVFSPVKVATVEIDIKPGSVSNSINPRSRGKVRVAILTTDAFDATTVDPTTVLFGTTGTKAAPVQSSLEDVDGDTDLILHFNTRDTGIACGDTSAILAGETRSGRSIEGSDALKTVGRR